MDIYWIKDDRRCGPATVPDVISLVQLGELTPDTPGWHRGCKNWVPLRTLPALKDFLKEQEEEQAHEEEKEPELPPIPLAEHETGEGEPNLPEGAVRVCLPRPWQRLLARLMDMALYAAVVLAVLRLGKVGYDAMLTPGHPIFWLPYILLEAYLLMHDGSTPGKLLMGIRVLNVGGASSNLTYRTALLRSILVFLFGMGMCILPLSLIMPAIAYFAVRSRGFALWDARSNTLPVVVVKVPFTHCLLTLGICVGALLLIGSLVQPWIPEIMARIQRESPAMADTLRKWMPQEAQGKQPEQPIDAKPAEGSETQQPTSAPQQP